MSTHEGGIRVIKNLRIFTHFKRIDDEGSVMKSRIIRHPISKKNWDVFISYRRSDGTSVANCVRTELERFTFPPEHPFPGRDQCYVYLDTAYGRTTDDFYQNNIRPALLNSRFLLIILTPSVFIANPNGSDNWVIRELNEFLAHHSYKRVLIARGRGNDLLSPIPESLSQLQNPHITDLRSISNYVLLRWWRRWKIREAITELIPAIFETDEKYLPLLRHENERRRGRSRAILAIISIFLAFIFAILTIYAFQQKNAAVRAQRLAEERFYQALNVADYIVYTVDYKLFEVPGASDARKEILEESRTLLEKLIKSSDASKTNLHLLGTRTAAYIQQGRIAIMEGKVEKAKEYYRKSSEYIRQMLETHPKEAMLQRNLCVYLADWSNLFVETGDLLTALAALDKSLDILNELNRVNGETDIISRDLAVTHNRRGDLLLLLKRKEDARIEYSQALEWSLRLLTYSKDKPEWLHDLAATYLRLGMIEYLLENRIKAREYYNASLQIMEPLLKMDESNIFFRRTLALIHSRLGDISIDEGATKIATDSYLLSKEIIELLLKSEPHNTQFIHDLLVDQQKLGILALKVNDLVTAEHYFDESLKNARKLFISNRSNPRWKDTIFRAYATLVEFLSQVESSESRLKEVLESSDKELTKDQASQLRVIVKQNRERQP